DRMNNEVISEDTDDNRWHPRQEFADEANGWTEAAASILGQIDRSQDTNGGGKESGQCHQHEASIDGVSKAATGVTDRRRQLDEKIPAKRSHALINEVAQYQEKSANGNEKAKAQNPGHELVHPSRLVRRDRRQARGAG